MFNYAPFSGEYVTFTAHGIIPQSLRDSSLYTRGPRKATLTRSFFFHIERTPNRRICSKQPVIARSGATRQSVLLYNAQKRTAVIKRNGFPRPVTSVTGLATAAYHDSLICRLVPLGGMTEVFLPGTFFSLLAISVHRRPLSHSFADSSPSRGAEWVRRFSCRTIRAVRGTAQRPSPTVRLAGHGFFSITAIVQYTPHPPHNTYPYYSPEK